MSVVRRSLAGLLLVGLPCVGIVVACSSTGRPPLREVPVVESPAPANAADDSFVVVFLGDPEERMRGITRSTLERHVDRLRSVGDGPAGRFELPDGRTWSVDPEVILVGGDISRDRDTSIANDLPLWEPLLDDGIVVLAGFGNHDWEPESWGDSPSHSLAGHRSNESTTAFTRETYRRSAAANPRLSYREFGPSSDHGPVTFLATYRGVDIVNFNTFLYQPSYRYPEGWPITCNPLGGGAGCQEFVDAGPQIAALESVFTSTGTDRPAIVMQHYPLSTSDRWWSDFGASDTTLEQRKGRLLDLMASRDDVVFLAGHNHRSSSREWRHAGRTIEEHVAPWFGGGGGFIALLVSPTEGVLAVETISFED